MRSSDTMSKTFGLALLLAAWALSPVGEKHRRRPRIRRKVRKYVFMTGVIAVEILCRIQFPQPVKKDILAIIRQNLCKACVQASPISRKEVLLKCGTPIARTGETLLISGFECSQAAEASAFGNCQPEVSGVEKTQALPMKSNSITSKASPVLDRPTSPVSPRKCRTVKVADQSCPPRIKSFHPTSAAMS